jgi:hypothetical protein
MVAAKVAAPVFRLPASDAWENPSLLVPQELPLITLIDQCDAKYIVPVLSDVAFKTSPFVTEAIFNADLD